MAKKKLWRDDQDEGYYMSVYFRMLDHPAFRSLSEAAIRVLLQCLRKAYGPGRYERKFKFTYPEAKDKLQLSDHTFRRAMMQLHDKGFINYWSPGGLRNEQKVAKEYQLSTRWKKWGEPDFIKLADGHYRSIHG